MVLCFKILISNINKEIYISSIKLTSKFVCNVRFCAHGCTEPFKIKARFFFIHQPLGNAISNSNRPRNGTTSRYLRNLKYNLFCHVEIHREIERCYEMSRRSATSSTFVSWWLCSIFLPSCFHLNYREQLMYMVPCDKIVSILLIL